VVDDNTIYYTNRMENRVYLVSGGARSDFVAPNNIPVGTAEGIHRLSYGLNVPTGVAYAFQSSGLLFSDWGNDAVKRVALAAGDNVYTELSGIIRPEKVDFDPIHARTFFVEENTHTVRMIDYGGGIRVIAGDGTAGYFGDGGPGASAQLRDPSSVAVDSRGNVYIADTGNHALRVVLGGALP